MDQQFNWIVSQIGAREHYAVPRAFHRRGHLQRFYTEFWSGRAAPFLRRLGGRAANFANRYHEELPAEKVAEFNISSSIFLAGEAMRGRSRNLTSTYEHYERVGRHFALDVNRALRREKLDRNSSCAFLMTTGALETCEYLKSRAIPIVVDQLDPARLDEESVLAEMEKFPGWQELPGRVPESYYQRLAREWELADLVLVNSDWSRQNLLNESVNPAKIVVVPLCYEAEGYEAESRGLVSSTPTNDEHPLIVLWIGQIILRKGIQYLFEAARRMQKNRIRFIVAGHVGISAAALSTAPSNVEILGRVPRTKALELFNAADVFALPTVSDGFALTQLEAMSFGLPVITTSHCGAVVTDGADGYIIPSGNVEALVEKIEILDRDRALLNHMKTNARLKPKEHRFTLDGYATAVETAMQRVRQEQLSK